MQVIHCLSLFISRFIYYFFKISIFRQVAKYYCRSKKPPNRSSSTHWTWLSETSKSPWPVGIRCSQPQPRSRLPMRWSRSPSTRPCPLGRLSSAWPSTGSWTTRWKASTAANTHRELFFLCVCYDCFWFWGCGGNEGIENV